MLVRGCMALLLLLLLQVAAEAKQPPPQQQQLQLQQLVLLLVPWVQVSACILLAGCQVQTGEQQATLVSLHCPSPPCDQPLQLQQLQQTWAAPLATAAACMPAWRRTSTTSKLGFMPC